MKPLVKAGEVGRVSVFLPDGRRKLHEALYAFLQGQPPKYDSREVKSHLSTLLDLPYENEEERRQFYRMWFLVVGHPELIGIPVTEEWIGMMYLILSSERGGVIHLASRARYHEGDFETENDALADLIRKIFRAFIKSEFIADMNRYRKLRPETSALHPESEYVWSIFPFWLYRRHHHVYSYYFMDSNYQSLDFIPFDQVLKYTPAFLLRCFEAACENESVMKYIIHFAEGKNIRKADFLRFPLNKKMAHRFGDFYAAPVLAHRWRMSKEEPLAMGPCQKVSEDEVLLFAYVHAFVSGLGGDRKMVNEFYGKFRNSIEDDYDFCRSVVQFFSPYSETYTAYELSRVLGYVQHQRFESDCKYSLKGRNIQSVRRASDTYYEEMRRMQLMEDEKLLDKSWKGDSYAAFETKVEKEKFRIVQLKEGRDLANESAQLGHCVSTYIRNCVSGNCTIWSMQIWDKETDSWRSKVTLELVRGEIVQAKGKYNRLPEPLEETIIHDWAKREEIRVVRY